MNSRRRTLQEIEMASTLKTLAHDMEHAAIRMAALLDHLESTVTHATQLRGAAECVRKWSEVLRG